MSTSKGGSGANLLNWHEKLCYTCLREVTMEKQNITLTLPKDVLKRVKVMAAEQGTSISAMMEDLLQNHLGRHEGYDKARQRQTAILTKGLDMGTGGRATWKREQLHER